jgi:hypothetical protein
MKGAPRPNDCLDAGDFGLPPGQAKIAQDVPRKARKHRERCFFLWGSVPFGYSGATHGMALLNADSEKFHNYANHHTQGN